MANLRTVQVRDWKSLAGNRADLNIDHKVDIFDLNRFTCLFYFFRFHIELKCALSYEWALSWCSRLIQEN